MTFSTSQDRTAVAWSGIAASWFYFWGRVWLVQSLQWGIGYCRDTWRRRFHDPLQDASHALQDLRDLIRVGVFPSEVAWLRVSGLPAPWGGVFSPVLLQLREQGAAIVPTLSRWIEWLQEMREQARRAQSRASQVRLQLRVLIATIPILMFALPQVVAEPLWESRSWWGMCALAFALGLAGLWVLELQVNSALRGGVAPSRQHHALWVQTAGELVLAWVHAGLPGDVAWARAYQWLNQQCPVLADAWGAGVWALQSEDSDPMIRPLRECIEWSVCEGVPLTERFTSVLEQGRQVNARRIEKSLEELPTHALLPLFLTVAPANLVLLGCAVLQPVAAVG